VFAVPPDMVFIDGDHAYESVVRDIKWGVSTLKNGGLICGHDRDRQAVRNALDRTLGKWVAGPDSIWWSEWVIHKGAPKKGTWVPIH
jgi:hypothetical protein